MLKPVDAEDCVRLVSSALVAAYVGFVLARRGWAWLSWLPVAILTFAGMALVWVLVWYLRRKLTYEYLARRTKADLRAGGDGWPGKRGQ